MWVLNKYFYPLHPKTKNFYNFIQLSRILLKHKTKKMNQKITYLLFLKNENDFKNKALTFHSFN
jgi:hypothetical protein